MPTANLRWIAVLVVWCVVGPATAHSADPKPAGPDKATTKKLLELTELADSLLEEGDFAEAVGPAREAAKLVAKVFGEKDWRAFDAARRLKLAETAKDLPNDKRNQLAVALAVEAHAKGLESSAPAEAQKLAVSAAEGNAAALGEGSPESARAWHLIGRLRLATNDIRGAMEANRKALESRRKALPEGHPCIAYTLHTLGNGQVYSRDFDGARRSFEEALAIVRKALNPDDAFIATCLYNLGVVQVELQNNGGARNSFEEARDIRRKALKPDDPLIASCLHNLGIVQANLSDYEGAKQSQTEALAIFGGTRKPDDPLIADCLTDLANAQRALGDIKGARKSQTEALAILRKTLNPDERRLATVLTNLGVVQHDLGEHEGAKASQTEALAIFRKVLKPDDSLIADCLHNLGEAQRALGEYEGARMNKAEALAILRKALEPDDPRLATSLADLGDVQHDLRDYEGAWKSKTEALAILRKTLKPDDPRLATSLADLGIVQFDLRDYEGAKKSHQQALDIIRKALKPDDPLIADCLTNLAAVQRLLRDLERAKRNNTDALAILRKALKPDDPRLATVLTNLGAVQYDLREYEEARKSDMEALAILYKILPKDHPRIASGLLGLGAVQCSLRDYEGAKKSHQQALDIFRKALKSDDPLIADCLHNLGYIDLVSGVPTMERAIDLSDALAIKKTHLLALSVSQTEAEQLHAATQSRMTLSLYISAALAPSVKADATTVYDRVGGLKGVVTARQRWARELREAANEDTRRLLDELRGANLQLLRMAVRSDKLVGELVPEADPTQLDSHRRDLERRLAAQSEAFRLYRTKADLGGAAIQAALPEGVCLIDFLVYTHIGPPPNGKSNPVDEQRVVAFVVRAGGGPVRIVELGPTAKIETLVTGWRNRYSSKPALDGGYDPGAALRKEVWLKLEPHMGNPQLVAVSPDGPLNFLPFGALPGTKERTFLIQEYAFAIAPAPVLLPEMLAKQPARPEAPTLLLVGGVDFGVPNANPAPADKLPTVPKDWKPLLGTADEVTDLHKLFANTFGRKRAAPVVELVGGMATKASFVAAASSHTYVHLATHGFFADEAEELGPNPRLMRLDRRVSGLQPGVLSGVVFAGANRPRFGEEECLLVALEAGEVDMRMTELVTLSACDTGNGRTGGGEGVLGLQRAFHVGGARAVLASQWKIPDGPTRALMLEFYSRLWAEKPVGKAEALRRAQVRIIEGWDGARGEFRGPTEPKGEGGLPPHFWAAFTIAGDWR